MNILPIIIKGTLIFPFAFSVAVSGSLALKQSHCLMLFFADMIVAGFVVLFNYLFMRWEIVGVWFRYILIFFFLTAVVIGFLRNISQSIKGILTLNDISLHIVVSSIFGLMIIAILGAQDSQGEFLHLNFPLKETEWIIAQGGSSLLLNQHRRVATQSYALDITALNRWKMRASGLLPKDCSKYEIYGKPVYAPCSGRVLSVVDGYPDLTPPNMDKEHPPGNYIAITCQNDTVVLAHLKPDSIRVVEGDRISEGRIIAKVGNSGNTSEPHLHIHAVKGEIIEEKKLFWSGEPVPMMFKGRFLIRGDRSLSASR